VRIDVDHGERREVCTHGKPFFVERKFDGSGYPDDPASRGADFGFLGERRLFGRR